MNLLPKLPTRHRLVLLALVAAVQLAVPAAMIVGREQVLTRGEVFRFRTAPIDPYDAFRGRYVALDFEDETAPVARWMTLRSGEQVFVSLERDRQGFARLASVSRERPATGPYLRLPVRRVELGRARFELPFDRYYLDERLAPDAERAHREDLRRGEARRSYAEVRVYRGRAVLEELYVAGRPVAERVRGAGRGG